MTSSDKTMYFSLGKAIDEYKDLRAKTDRLIDDVTNLARTTGWPDDWNQFSWGTFREALKSLDYAVSRVSSCNTDSMVQPVSLLDGILKRSRRTLQKKQVPHLSTEALYVTARKILRREYETN